MTPREVIGWLVIAILVFVIAYLLLHMVNTSV